jgi:DNA-binding MarR family transcriptional regulator
MQNVHRVFPALSPATQSLLRQAEALQAQAAELAGIIGQADDHGGPTLVGSRGTAAVAKSIIHARNQRSRFLPTSLFADPAWDILLELYSAEVAQRRMSVSQVCAAAKVPATTALRWLSTLEARKLVERQVDPLDARRYFVELSPVGKEAMDSFFDSIKDALLAA